MIDLFGLGNAIVDSEVNVEEDFLARHDIPKGHMTLVDTPRMQALMADLEGHKIAQSSGGSAANTIFAVQAFGFNTAYACKVADDRVGRFFRDDMSNAGVQLNGNALLTDGYSGQCLVLITEDAERTMNTNLGVSADLSEHDVDWDKLDEAKFFYVEGYLASSASSVNATMACRKITSDKNIPVAASLSDPAMVEFCRDGLESILGNGVQTLFCNEEEALTWTKTDRIDIAIAELKDIAPELYITIGAKGSLVVTKEGQHQVDGTPTNAIDTTGAGDMYAGACLAARLANATPVEAARFANRCASTVVAQYGARLPNLTDYQLLKERYSS